jgi:hypothetical protein
LPAAVTRLGAALRHAMEAAVGFELTLFIIESL